MPEIFTFKCRKSRLPPRRHSMRYRAERCHPAMEKLIRGDCKYVEVTTNGVDGAMQSARTTMINYAKSRGVTVTTYVSERGSLVVYLAAPKNGRG